MPKPAHARPSPRETDALPLGDLEETGDLGPSATIIRVGYEVAGVPQFLEIRASREMDAYALYHWFKTRMGARGPDVRIVETEKTIRPGCAPGREGSG